MNSSSPKVFKTVFNVVLSHLVANESGCSGKMMSNSDYAQIFQLTFGHLKGA